MPARVPRDVTLTAHDFEFTLEGEAAFGHLSPLDHTCRASFMSDEGDPRWCFDYAFRLIDEWMMSPNTFAPGIDTLHAGRIDVYMATEGRVTLTFTVPELARVASFEATGVLDGAVVEHPVTCTTEAVAACDRQGWGGQQFAEVSSPAAVGSVTYSERPNNVSGPDLPTPGTVGAGSCIYPSAANPDKSPAPADHPTGCDADENGVMNFSSAYLTSTLSPTVVTTAHVRAESVTGPGPVYTGFAAHQAESAEALEGPGTFGSFGYWYSRQIRCPSGNWAACR